MSLVLKVKVGMGSDPATKTMRFTPNMSVAECCKALAQKTGESGADRGLFQPAVPGKSSARWLKMNRTLQYYDINSESKLEYKKKHRPLKLRLMDGTQKTVLIDDSLTVSDIVETVGSKMGIKNPEEFSLQLVDAADQDWLNSGQALHEQGVADDETVVMKKKFFFNDAMIDKSDPVQLHLLYVQCRDAVVGGRYPTSQSEAKDLAAMQCQIVEQDFNPSRHKGGFLKLQDYLPAQYKKVKGIEKDIYTEWRKLVGMTEVNAKFRYVQLCRSLKTYGITTFVVKYKEKKKWLPLYLGITRDSIIKMNYETREIIAQNPLTHLKRWAASGNTFTLDFGDYEDSYLNLQTPEAEQISQLIAGYIDIILKARSDAATLVEDDDANRAEVMNMAPVRGMAAKASTTSTAGRHGGKQAGGGMYGAGKQSSSMSNVPASQQINITDLKSAQKANSLLRDELNDPKSFSQSNLSAEQLREQLLSHQNAVANAAKKLGDEGQVDPSKLNKAAMMNASKQLMQSMMALGATAKMAAIADGKTDHDLLNSAKAVSDAIAKLLGSSEDLMANPHDPGNRQMFDASLVGLNHAAMHLNAAVKSEMTDPASQEMMLACAKSVADAIANMVELNADAAKRVKDGAKMKAMLQKGKAVEENGTATTAAAVALAPAMVNPESRAIVDSLGGDLNHNVSQLVALAKQSGTDPVLLQALLQGEVDVQQAIQGMLAASATSGKNAEFVSPEQFDIANNALVTSVNKLKGDMKDKKNIIEATKAIALNSNKLVTASKGIAAQQPPHVEKRLIAASKACADAVAALVNQAKATAANPSQPNQAQLAATAEALLGKAQVLHGDAGKFAQQEALRREAKFCAAASTLMVSQSKLAAARMPNSQSKADLLAASKATADAIQALLNSVGQAQKDRGDDAAQMKLVNVAKGVMHPTTNNIATAKKAAIELKDPAQKQSLKNAADAAGSGVQRLAAMCKRMLQQSGQGEIDDALEQFSATQADLEAAEFAAQGGFLVRPPGLTQDGATQLLKGSATEFTKAQRALVQCAQSNPNGLGAAAKAVAAATQDLVNSIKSVAAVTTDREAQKQALAQGRIVAQNAQGLVSTSRSVAVSPKDPQLAGIMKEQDKKTTASLETLIGAATGVDTSGVDTALAAMGRAKGHLKPAKSNTSFALAAEELTSSAKMVQAAAGQMGAAAKNNPRGIPSTAKIISTSVPGLVRNANAAMGVAKDEAAVRAIKTDTEAVIASAENVLNAVKSRVTDRTPAADAKLEQAQGTLDERVKALQKTLGTGGNIEADEAVNSIMRAIEHMDRGTAPAVGNPIREVQFAAKGLAASTQKIVAASKQAPDQLGAHAQEAAKAVGRICNAAASAGKESTGGGVSATFDVPAQTILNASKKLVQSEGDTKAIVANARTIAQTTAQLVSVAKSEATATKDVASQQALLRAAQALANATSAMAKAAKASAQKQSGSSEGLRQASAQLDTATHALLDAAPKNEGGGGGSAMNLSDVQALQNHAKQLANATSTLIGSATTYSAKPSDKSLQTAMGASANQVVSNIRKLLDATSSLTPGVKDCKEAAESTQEAINELGSAALAVAVGNLENDAPKDKSHQDFQKELVAAAKHIQEATHHITTTKSTEVIGKNARIVGNQVMPLATAAVNAAKTTKDSKAQDKFINLTKDLVEAEKELLEAAEAVAIDPASQSNHAGVAAASDKASNALGSLLKTLQSEVDMLAELDGSIKAIAAAKKEFSTPAASMEYAQAKDDIETHAKAIGTSARQLVVVDKSNIVQIGAAASSIAQAVPLLIEAAKAAAAVATEKDTKNALIKEAKNLTDASEKIVQNAKKVAMSPKDAKANKAMAEAVRDATTAIGTLQTAAKKGDLLDYLTEQATDDIGKALGSLDASMLFSSAGQLEAKEGTNFGILQNEVGKMAQAVANESSGLTQTAPTGTPEQTGQRAQALGKATAKLCLLSTDAAATVDSGAVQQQLLTAAKAVAIAASQHVVRAKKAAAHKDDAAAQGELQQSNQAVASAAQELTAAMQAAADDQTRGAKELNQAIAMIHKSLDAFDSCGRANATPEGLVEQCRGVASATAQLVGGCNNSNPEAISLSSQDLADSTVGMLEFAKGCQGLTDKQIVKNGLMDAAKASAQAIQDLLNAAMQITTSKMTPQKQQKMSEQSTKVADSIQQMVEVTRQLPGAENLKLEEEGDDLEELAEQELSKAAEVIRRAAEMMSKASENAKAKASMDGLDNVDITGPILIAATAITSACGTLVQCAASAQKERVKAKQSGKAMYRKDPMWANGLISAAQQVAGAVQQLVISANKAVQGEAEEEELVAAARGVASSTAQLVSASRAKAADPFSKTQQALGKAAKAVAEATSQLVAAAKEASTREQEKEDELLFANYAASKAAEFQAQVKVLKMEKELEKARQQMSKLRKDQYDNKKAAGGAGGPPAAGRGGMRGRGGPPRGRGRGRGGPVSPRRGGRGQPVSPR